jgi:hypothetical protein
MHLDLDMSGRIEETQRPSVLAIAGSLRCSIYVPAAEKRKVIDALEKRQLGWSKTRIHVLLFSTLLYLLIRDYITKVDLFTIDIEYEGFDLVIRERVVMLCRRKEITIRKDQLTFQQIGKKSPAHDLAYNVFKGRISPDRIIFAEEILREFRQ